MLQAWLVWDEGEIDGEPTWETGHDVWFQGEGSSVETIRCTPFGRGPGLVALADVLGDGPPGVGPGALLLGRRRPMPSGWTYPAKVMSMAPRAYSMRARAEQVARTRERIVDAALEVFARRGARGTTMTEVARAADVATATVTNHFATPELLLQAVVDRLMADIRLPNASIFAGTQSVPTRLRALTAAMFDFYERTNRWWALLGPEITDIPVLAKANADVSRALHALYAEALAGVEDETLAKAVAGLVHPATYTTLRQAGLSLDQATDVVTDAVTQQARKHPPST